jgi:O-antigen/teichoic acid export membrane protein
LSETRSIGRAAALGAALIASRSALTQLLALGALVVLTRQLSPREFGVLAFGMAIAAFATAFADLGLAAGLIRTPRDPTTVQLRAALALQLLTTCVATAIGCAIGFNGGTVGAVTAIMLLSLPILAWQTPARILMERDLAYKRLSLIEFAQSLAYWTAAVIAAFSPAGVWGVAAASVVQTVVGAAMTFVLVPRGRLTPLFSLDEIRPMLRFGAGFQAVSVTNLLRDQGINVAVGAVMGLSGLGVWNVASRVLRVPFTIFAAVWRVSYPSMARIVQIDPRPRRVLEGGTALAAVTCGFLLAPLGGASVVLVPLLFGSEWRQAGYVLAPASAALMIGAPISLAVGGYLYAIGALQPILKSAVLHTVVWIGLTLALLPAIGIIAVGVAHIPAAAVDAIMLERAARAASGARVTRPLLAPTLAAVVAGGAAFVVGIGGQASIGRAVVAVIVAVVGYCVLLGLGALTSPSGATAEALRRACAVVTAQRGDRIAIPPTQVDAPSAP